MNLRILIADDHSFVRQRLREFLEISGWEVCAEAENGREAVEMASATHPELIILDLAMPTMDGLSAARVLRQRMPAIPIILHTLHSSAEVNAEAARAGINRVVSKVDSRNSLGSAIVQIFGEGPATSQASKADAPASDRISQDFPLQQAQGAGQGTSQSRVTEGRKSN